MTDRIQLLKNTLQRKLFECFNAVRTPRHEEPLSKRLKYPVKKLLYILFAHNKEKLYEAFNKNISRFSVEGTELWGNRSLTFECPRTRRPYGDWTDLVYMPFEFIEVPVPRKYDEMLRQQYGDYMKIPEHIGENMHGEMIISTEFSYDELKEKLL